MKNSYPIVGAFFRPPAQDLIDILAVGTPLTLMSEPDNPYDPNAIAVFLASKDIPEQSYATLDTRVSQCGLSVDAILSQDYWQLGYIPKNLAQQLKEQSIVTDESPVEGIFGLSPDGKPRFCFSDA